MPVGHRQELGPPPLCRPGPSTEVCAGPSTPGGHDLSRTSLGSRAGLAPHLDPHAALSIIFLTRLVEPWRTQWSVLFPSRLSAASAYLCPPGQGRTEVVPGPPTSGGVGAASGQALPPPGNSSSIPGMAAEPGWGPRLGATAARLNSQFCHLPTL